MTAHGGAVESLLDEATAELAKLEWAPVLATIELANFSIKKVRRVGASENTRPFLSSTRPFLSSSCGVRACCRPAGLH